ncbi:trypsin-like serine peptidase [Rhodococcus sp. OK302]|uniref:trypsin-like serine peptidase n=1 Tax=Rhodococcus sp. OK302 TaxID=1882769 RepID=UPI000B93A8FC|nr:hypothetical protein [Rhodococcus sp. OK302]OYD60724.1 hypothetical protein BDB13_5593 [Rhodococcus sp. OK302]
MLHPRKSILASLACAVLVAVAGTSAAQAAPRADGALTASPVTRDTADISAVSRVTGDAAADQRIVDYWTPERMRNAREPVLTKDASGAVTRTSQSQVAAIDPDEDGIVDGYQPSRIAGKLFYRDPADGEPGSCSGTVVNAPSKSLVLTAGHCLKTGGVNGTPGYFYDQVMFVPNYKYIPQNVPNIYFVADTMAVAQQWSKYGNVGKDLGALVVKRVDGLTLEEHTGRGATFVFDQGAATQRRIITQAYPLDIDNGGTQATCRSTTALATGWSTGGIEIGDCRLSLGASGSGWILNWGDANNQQITGVTSMVATNDGSNFSPYFDNVLNIMYTSMSTMNPSA